MMKRLAALLIALAVGTAPVALEICQLTCASRSADSDVAHAAHGHAILHSGAASQPSCHEAGNAVHSVSPGSAPCDHDDGTIASSLVTTRPDTAAAAPVHTIIFDFASTAGARFADRGRISSAGSRLELRLSSPLRI